MNCLKLMLCVAALVLTGAFPVSAASITFALDCQFSGAANDGACTTGGSFGTVTLSDSAANPNHIDFIVDVAAGWYPTGLYLNLTPGFAPAGFTTWQAITTSTVNSVTQATDASGVTYLYMDLSLLSQKNYTDPWVGTFALSNGAKPPTYYDLSPTLFLNITNDPQAGLPAPTALVYLAVNLQNCTGTACPPSPQTAFVGSTTVVPEPASLLLLGSGLGAIAMRARRRARANG